MGYFGPYFMILVQPTSKVVFNALKSVTTFDLISYDHQSPYVGTYLKLSQKPYSVSIHIIRLWSLSLSELFKTKWSPFRLSVFSNIFKTSWYTSPLTLDPQR